MVLILRKINLGIFKKIFSDFIIPVALAVVLAMLINRFLVFKIYIPSLSMSPTLEVGDQCFATKIYNTNNIKRGDIIVFYSNELGELLIKRVIGLPGEHVEIDTEGNVSINATKLDEPYVVNKTAVSDRYVFDVPADHFLFLGDNRSNSRDSRFWKDPYIDKKDIKGKARIRVFPFNRFGILK
ncbi:MAG: signal peptidase I [Bacillota bacterium]|nr:signal peptidase I [Bacillota bacterium]